MTLENGAKCFTSSENQIFSKVHGSFQRSYSFTFGQGFDTDIGPFERENNYYRVMFKTAGLWEDVKYWRGITGAQILTS